MGRRTILLIASILIAAVGTALIALYVRGADSRAREGTAQVQVLFALKTIPAGTSIEQVLSGDSVRERDAALASVPRDSLSRVSIGALQNVVTKVAIVAGAPVQRSMFGAKTTDSSTVGITPGRVGASFELTDPQRVANLLSPGDFVSVYWVPESSGKASEAIKRVQVLQIGTETLGSSTSLSAAAARAANPNADQVPRTILTFNIKPDDELLLLQYQRDGELALGLLADQDPKNGPSD